MVLQAVWPGKAQRVSAAPALGTAGTSLGRAAWTNCRGLSTAFRGIRRYSDWWVVFSKTNQTKSLDCKWGLYIFTLPFKKHFLILF